MKKEIKKVIGWTCFLVITTTIFYLFYTLFMWQNITPKIEWGISIVPKIYLVGLVSLTVIDELLFFSLMNYFDEKFKRGLDNLLTSNWKY